MRYKRDHIGHFRTLHEKNIIGNTVSVLALLNISVDIFRHEGLKCVPIFLDQWYINGFTKQNKSIYKCIFNKKF